MMPYPEGKGRAVINRGGARGSRAASWLIWPCTTRARSIRHPALADQPGVDELPFVPASGLEVEQWGPAVLQLEEELQRLAPGCSTGINGLAFHPPVPFPDSQRPCVLLLHPAVQHLAQPREAGTNPRRSGGEPG